MIKVIFQDSQEELVKASGAMTTLIETESHIKSAASDAVTDKLLRENRPDDKHFAVHLIAMGSQEKYGFNRNGDGWPEDGLTRRHHTFVSHGHLFREHKNSGKEHAIGSVKASAYNKPMSRVELVVHGDKDLAAEEYELAKAGKALSFSMSAKVPYDECSICENKAKGSKKYCTHLKQGMCQYNPKFRKFAFAINRHPTFFDISRVKNPADRIAHFLSYDMGDDMAKAASAAAFAYSDDLAAQEGIMIEDQEFGCSDLIKHTMLIKLAETEAWIEKAIKGENVGSEQGQFFKEAVTRAFESDDVTEEDMTVLRECPPDRLFAGLAKRAAVLPFKAFVSYSLGIPMAQVDEHQAVKEASRFLPTAFRDLAAAPVDHTLETLFDPDFTKAACNTGDPIDSVMDRVGNRHSVHPHAARVRIIRITASRGGEAPSPIKYASAVIETPSTSEARRLAKAYAMYKIAFCASADMASKTEDFVDQAVRMLVSYQNLI